jgi:hypothetical protein
MNKDEFFQLAVRLAAPTIPQGAFGTPNNIPDVSIRLRVAYNALLDAYEQIPHRGPASTA